MTSTLVGGEDRPMSFGFTVRRTSPAPPLPFDEDAPAGDWLVYLPERFGTWVIAGGLQGGVPHADAVASLEAFVLEAMVALDSLESRREVTP